MTRARTPANFPRMKHRAAGRIARRKAMENLPFVLEGMAEAFRPFTEVLNRMADAIGRIAHAPIIIATRPQDWAPAPRQFIWPEQERTLQS